MRKDIEIFIDKFARELLEDNVAIFAGAGLSMPLGFVSWKELLKPLADELDIDIEKINDLVGLAQYYSNEKCGNRHNINQIILEEFDRKAGKSENHKILARLPLSTYWTSNYDSLIEDSLREEGRNPDIKYTVEHLALTKKNRDAIVYKMHGDKNHPSQAIIIKDDYETYHMKYAAFINALSGDLVSKTFLFLGFSFSDPNLDHILSRIRINFANNQRTHYCILKEVKKRLGKESPEDFKYRKRQQELFIKDLQRFNIQTLLIEEHSEITKILREIEKRVNINNIFISGSAHTFKPWEKDDAERFIRKLSKTIIDKGYNIVSGIGLGLGDFVVSGALEGMYYNDCMGDNSRLIVKPFPQKVSPSIDITQLWHTYRKGIISKTGVTILLFGNKEKDGKLISADGVYREFIIAKEQGNLIVPIGATGHMAREIWEEMNENFDEYYPNSTEKMKTLFERLNAKEIDSDELINIVLEFIDVFRNGTT